jgi:preprotein translocase subunit SecG
MMILAVWYHKILAIFFGLWALLLMLVILVQRGKGVGLAGAFGGTGGSAAFGAKTGDVLTWVTIVGAVLLLVITIGLNFVFVEVPELGAAAANQNQSGNTQSEGPGQAGDGEDTSWLDSHAYPPPGHAAIRLFGQDEA